VNVSEAQTRFDWKLGVIGGIAGLAWGAGFRSFMWQISPTPHVNWAGTFLGILLPGAVTGTLLGIAEARRRANRLRGLRWFALAPAAFAIAPMLSSPNFFVILVTTGLGGGAIGVAVLAVAGGFSLGTGPLWARIVTGILAIALLVGVTLTVPSIGGPSLALTTARGAWVAVLVASFLAILAVASAIPFRRIPADA